MSWASLMVPDELLEYDYFFHDLVLLEMIQSCEK